MKAVCLLEPRVVRIQDVTEPACRPDEVVVQMRAVGLCGSDLSVYAGHRTVPYVPWVLGHEGGGTVVDIGSDVIGRAIGQLVVIEPNVPCLRCPACATGRTSLCPQRRILGMDHPGILAERVAVPARMAWPVPEQWGPEQLVVLEPFAVAVAAARRSGIASGDEAIVVGAGSLGLQMCRALVALGASVWVVDVDEARMRTAHAVGANPAPARRTFRYVFETAGAPSAFGASVAALASGGVLTLMGLGHRPVELSTSDVVRRGQTMLGSIIYDHPVDFRAAIGLMSRDTGNSRDAVGVGMQPHEAAMAFERAAAAPAKSWIDLAAWS